MNPKTFSEALVEIDDRYLESALLYRKPKTLSPWLKWGIAAACVALLVGVTYPRHSSTVPVPDKEPGEALLTDGGPGTSPMGADGGVSDLASDGGADHLEAGKGVSGSGPDKDMAGSAPVGAFPEGVDPVIATIAVYPPSATIQDVENATITTIDEGAAAVLEPFCAHLPKWLPEDFHFRQASIYETTMKDGTTYHMLRITYTNGSLQEIQTVEIDGEPAAVVPDPSEWGDELTFHMWDFRPGTDQEIYTMETVFKYKSDSYTYSSVDYKSLFDIANPSSLYLDCGDIYVGVFPETCLSSEALGPEDLVNIICSMQ